MSETNREEINSRLSDEQRFWEKVDRGDDETCWNWQAFTNRDGYGRFNVDGLIERAHRVAYSVECGDIGESKVLHTCDNPTCVNPDHLYLGDQGDNIKDAYERDRKAPIIGEEHPVAKLTEPDVKEIRKRAERGRVQRKIAEDFGVSRARVGQIVRKEAWAHVE